MLLLGSEPDSSDGAGRVISKLIFAKNIKHGSEEDGMFLL